MKIDFIKHFSYGIQTGYPFVKESPFIEPFKRALIQMKSSGVLNRIWHNHVIHLETQCEEKKVLNGFCSYTYVPNSHHNLSRCYLLISESTWLYTIDITNYHSDCWYII